jgi:hypothetical protein
MGLAVVKKYRYCFWLFYSLKIETWHPLGSDRMWEPKLNTEHHSKQVLRIQTLQIIAWCPVVYSGQNPTNKLNVIYWCLFEWKAQNFTYFNERFLLVHARARTHTHTHTSNCEGGGVLSSGFCKTYIFIRTFSLKCKEINHQSQQFFSFFFPPLRDLVYFGTCLSQLDLLQVIQL